jgi:hypothetical protein
VVKTKNAGFLMKNTDYVVAKQASVTEGYGQDSDVFKKLTPLEGPVLLGFGGTVFFLSEICYGSHDRRALLRGSLGGIM